MASAAVACAGKTEVFGNMAEVASVVRTYKGIALSCVSLGWLISGQHGQYYDTET
jgi:hypothetical protein